MWFTVVINKGVTEMNTYEIVLTKHQGLWWWGVDRVSADGSKTTRVLDSDTGFLTAATAAEIAELRVARLCLAAYQGRIAA
jgi:hypothetical protein